MTGTPQTGRTDFFATTPVSYLFLIDSYLFLRPELDSYRFPQDVRSPTSQPHTD
jgi:hypothetical protein